MIGHTVNGIVNPFIDRVNLGAKLCWVDVKASFVGRDDIIESRVENTNNFRTLVVHNGMVFLVP